jgi:hypothetical protein
MVSFLPLISIAAMREKNFNSEQFYELCYWLGLSILLVLGICLSCHQDPRYYRYNIAVLSFASIFGIDFLFTQCLRIKPLAIKTMLILALSVPGYPYMWYQNGSFLYPTFKDNLNVLLNKTHTIDHIRKYFPLNATINENYAEFADKINHGAWDKGIAGVTKLSAFLLPIRPQVGMWLTSVVRYDSYGHESLIKQDLKNFGLDWIMTVKNNEFTILSIDDYAREAALYEKHPKETLYNYGFPNELSSVSYQ